ncbi:MAG TPA: HRDC domain-containing protein [Acidimicrobiales bacterium]
MAAEWVDTDAGLADVVAALDGEEAYSVDTEFHRERTYYPRLALVQVSWDSGAVLIDPLAVDLTPFASVLVGSGVAVAHAAEQDLEVLERACGVGPARLFDTQLAAGFLGTSTASLVSLVERMLGRQVLKGDRLTDWTRRPLSSEQRAYAASDVAHLLELAEVITEQLTGRGRLVWAEQECELLLRRSRQPQDPATAWWRLKDSRSMRGAARLVAQAVASWREQRAAAQDLPPRFVLSDLALISIAHRPPRNREQLLAVRGLDGRQMRPAVADDLLEVINDALSGDASAIRQPPSEDVDRSLRPAVALAAAWVAQRSADLDIDAALLATRADIAALLRGDRRSRLGAGWRAELIGEPLRRLAAGEAALAFDGAGSLLLEARSHLPVTLHD